MSKENKKVLVITVIIFVLIVIGINVIQSINKDELVISHLYDIEIQKLEELDDYLIYNNGLIKFRDAARQSDDDTEDYAVAKRVSITYIANDESVIKIYEVKYKNPIQEFVVHRNKGMKVAEILVPAGMVDWNGGK